MFQYFDLIPVNRILCRCAKCLVITVFAFGRRANFHQFDREIYQFDKTGYAERTLQLWGADFYDQLRSTKVTTIITISVSGKTRFYDH
jgi:hypothetical protein